jgi:hypothetical protein
MSMDRLIAELLMDKPSAYDDTPTAEEQIAKLLMRRNAHEAEEYRPTLPVDIFSDAEVRTPEITPDLLEEMRALPESWGGGRYKLQFTDPYDSEMNMVDTAISMALQENPELFRRPNDDD